MGENSFASLTDFFDGYIEQFADTVSSTSNDDIFSSLEALEQADGLIAPFDHKSSSSCTTPRHHEAEVETPKGKRQKVSSVELIDGSDKVSHITVERNRRKQMNEHLTVLRSLMPCFYVKRGDQASIIGGVVDYITELQQVLQSLEAKKQRKVYSDHHHVLSPGRSSPRKPPLSPRPGLLPPISPRTPQPLSPAYRPNSTSRLQQQQQQLQPLVSLNPAASAFFQPSVSSMALPSPSSSSNSSSNSDIVANYPKSSSVSKAAAADVEVKFCGSNLVVKTISPQLPGQTTKIVSVLEDLSLEILHVGINTFNETMVNSFTIKIGIECELSVEDLVQHIHQTFC